MVLEREPDTLQVRFAEIDDRRRPAQALDHAHLDLRARGARERQQRGPEHPLALHPHLSSPLRL
jgi:hypothetical protein